jgi:ribonuclease Z
MSVREVVVLGTASQVPTHERAHNGLLLRWDDHDVLIDPGEGTQRQLTFAGLSTSRIVRICLTHAHGDHCFGLPGVLARMSLDGVRHEVDLHHPVAASGVVDALVAAVPHARTPLVRHPAHGGGTVVADGSLRVRAVELAHSVPTLGWRFEEPDGWRLRPERLEQAGVFGPDRARLQREGRVRVGSRTVELEEVAVPRRGQSVAVVMDTGWCGGALELAAGVDLLVIEATFLEPDRDRAGEVGHLTAAQAVQVAARAGARRVVLTHFSQRYTGTRAHEAEAREAAAREGLADLDLVVATDLTRVALPPRE